MLTFFDIASSTVQKRDLGHGTMQTFLRQKTRLYLKNKSLKTQIHVSIIKKMQHQPLKGVTPPQVACKPSNRSSHDTGIASASTIRTQGAPRERSGRTELHCKVSQSQSPKAAIPVAKNTEANGGRATERDDERGRILLVRPTTSGRGHVATGRRARAVRLTTGR